MGRGPMGWATLVASLLLSGAAPAAVAQPAEDAPASRTLAMAPPAPPAAVEFIRAPLLSTAQLSPSGRYLAYVTNHGHASRLWIADLDAGDDPRDLAPAESAAINWISWKGNDRLLVSRPRSGLGEQVDAIHRADGTVVELRPASRFNPDSPSIVLDTLAGDPDHVLMMVRDGGDERDVVRVNVQTGEPTMVLQGERLVLDYFVDREGEVMARLRLRGLHGRRASIERRDPASGRWIELADLRERDLRELPDFEVLGATDQPAQLFVRRRPERPDEGDTMAVHIFDFASGRLGPPLWRHDTYDVSAIVRDESTDELLAGCYWEDVFRCDFNDPELQAVMTGLSRFFENERSITVVSQSEDGRRWILSVTGPDEPGSYYLYDFVDRKVELIGNRYPWLPPERLGAMRRVDYTARDGTALSGYLTALPGETASPRPLIVMPHGGPEARDHFGYDRWAQFLASRGYQVFQPNFRGSSGFGRAFAEAGYRQWGQRMQDDVTDGVRHLIEAGEVDPARICIVGASYGGYAALFGGASQPDLYRCVVSIAGVGDLREMVRWERSTYGADSDRYEYWVRSIGDPNQDRAAMDAVSPIRFADSWVPPVLLIHGERDQIVPVEQSADFARALERAGKPVRLVRVERAGHSDWPMVAETRLLTELETFLSQHLPVDAPAPETTP